MNNIGQLLEEYKNTNNIKNIKNIKIYYINNYFYTIKLLYNQYSIEDINNLFKYIHNLLYNNNYYKNITISDICFLLKTNTHLLNNIINDKFIKFNNKYFIDIYGPISFYILKPKIKNLPLIILFGDLHSSKKNEYNHNFLLNLYNNFLNELDDLSKKYGISTDFFAEYGNNLNIDTNTIESGSSILFKHLIYDNIDCYFPNKRDLCKYKNIRFHLSDARKLFKKNNINQIIPENEILKYKDIIYNNTYIKKYIDDNNREINNDINIISIIYKIIKFNKLFIETNFKNSNDIKGINIFMLNILADIYFILRSFKNYIKISIGVFGDFHVYSIQKTLIELGLYEYIYKSSNIKYEPYDNNNVNNIIKIDKFIDLDNIIFEHLNNY